MQGKHRKPRPVHQHWKPLTVIGLTSSLLLTAPNIALATPGEVDVFHPEQGQVTALAVNTSPGGTHIDNAPANGSHAETTRPFTVAEDENKALQFDDHEEAFTNEEIPFTVEIKEDANLIEGTEIIEQKGEPGLLVKSSNAGVENGTVVKFPVKEIRVKGTGKARNNWRVTGDEAGSHWKAVNDVTAYQLNVQNKAVNLALQQVGKQYIWGATGDNAFDCSGLIYWVYNKHLGKQLPRTAYEQGITSEQISIDQLQPGDLVYTPTHIGMYIGKDEKTGEALVVHASSPTYGVIITPLSWFTSIGFKAARVH